MEVSLGLLLTASWHIGIEQACCKDLQWEELLQTQDSVVFRELDFDLDDPGSNLCSDMTFPGWGQSFWLSLVYLTGL